MKKISLLILSMIFSMNVCITNISAQETNGFYGMLNNLFNGNSQEVVVQMNGEDITEDFINQFMYSYENDDVEAIEEYAADNYLLFVLPNLIQNRGINTGTYTTQQQYVVFYGKSQISGDTIRLPALVSYRITCTYDFNTGQITSSVRQPTVVLEDAEGVADEIRATSVTYTGTIINDGYTVRYTRISFIPQAYASLDEVGFWQTYNRFVWTGNIAYTPAS